MNADFITWGHDQIGTRGLDCLVGSSRLGGRYRVRQRQPKTTATTRAAVGHAIGKMVVATETQEVEQHIGGGLTGDGAADLDVRFKVGFDRAFQRCAWLADVVTHATTGGGDQHRNSSRHP
ncbi:hypothetical protein ALP29_201444 [Pseudomonas syringae pv. avii]|uniref:Uncharacterized protein n=1 Tax=Pseudomonas syringae pv. avii TaxID=663959 RepID=A0A3M5VC84_PSESX|nr:hypothetical protein ALP29_201444 [Pseudomonas syringae pv. avii]